MTARSLLGRTLEAGLVGGCVLLLATSAFTTASDTSTALAPASSTVGDGGTVRVSGDAPASPADPQATSPSVSDDGRTVVYGSAENGLSTGDQIVVRDVETRQTTLLGEASRDNTAPSVSGDGRLVAYGASASGFQERGAVGDIDVYVADLPGEGAVVRRATSAANDVRYQRQIGCRPVVIEEELDESARCGAQLSRDGRTLAIPSQLSLVSPRLSESLDGSSPPYLDSGGRAIGLVDFAGSQSLQILRISATGDDPVRIGTPRLSPEESFRFFEYPPYGDFCRDITLDPRGEGGAECYLGVEFTPDFGGCQTVFGRLVLDSPTPRGQTAVALAGREPCGEGGGAARRPAGPDGAPESASLRAEDCGPPPRVPAVAPPYPSDTNASVQVVNFGERTVGAAHVMTQTVFNNGSGVVDLDFETSDCAVQLAVPEGPTPTPDPDPTPEPVPPPCRAGQTLIDFGSCVAYIWFRTSAVTPYAATVDLRVGDFNFKTFRIVGAGTRRVVVVKRDPEGIGRFTGAGRPAGRVASIGANGRVVDGSAPSLSANGRYVAFESRTLTERSRTRILVHDTDRAGDRSYRAGDTTLASIVGARPNETQPRHALQPSLAGDGKRVAFLSTGADQFEGSDVHVRDLARNRTVLVSPPPPQSTSAQRSLSPSLSRDGSTVAFASNSPELAPADTEICCFQVYVRDLAPDFEGTGAPGTEIVSLPVDPGGGVGRAGLPAVDATGAVIAFVSDGALTPGTPAASTQIFARERYADPRVSPATLSFPTTQVDTTSAALPVVIRNDGPGPLLVAATVTGPFVLTDQCGVAWLHRGESCRILLAFAPTTPGAQEGRLRLTTHSGVWEGEIEIVILAGEAVPPSLEIEPAILDFADQGIGIASQPLIVTATNVGELPMSIQAAFSSGGDDFTVTGAAGFPDGAIPSPSPTSTAGPTSSATPTASATPTPGPSPSPSASPTANPAASPTAAPTGEAGVGDCAILEPGASCDLAVTFNPSALGDRTGSLVVVGTVGDLPLQEGVEASGGALEPEVEFSPAVIREGQVTFAVGSHFLPGVPVQLSWSFGPVALPVIIPDDTGAFRAPIVVMRDGGPGQRTLTVTMPGIGSFQTEPLLVVPGSAQPPDFTTRN